MQYCKKCGIQIIDEAIFCSNCGSIIKKQTNMYPTDHPIHIRRPVGITIMAILEILGGILYFFTGILMLFSTLFGAEIPFNDIFFGLGSAFGGILLILGALGLLIAYGLFKGIPWSRNLALILSFLGIILNIGSFPISIISIAIDLLIIYYLTRPHVKAFFEK